MSVRIAGAGSYRLGALLRGDAPAIQGWIAGDWRAQFGRNALVIVVGAGAFGGAMGFWRAPEQALWSAVKLPVVLLLTSLGNGLINGLLAPLLGIDLRFRSSLGAVLSSFALAAAILGALSPLMVFLVWNIPPPQIGSGAATAARSVMLLTLVAMIAFAGVTANLRLLGLLRRLGGSDTVALRLLFAWLAVNLLLGSQLSWIARPFIGDSRSPVAFFQPDAFHGNFFGGVLSAASSLWAQIFPSN
jgi:hypothetical protein